MGTFVTVRVALMAPGWNRALPGMGGDGSTTVHHISTRRFQGVEHSVSPVLAMARCILHQQNIRESVQPPLVDNYGTLCMTEMCLWASGQLN